jgi:hypothetical protein
LVDLRRTSVLQSTRERRVESAYIFLSSTILNPFLYSGELKLALKGESKCTKPKKYVIKIKEKGHWRDTRWTNPKDEKTSMDKAVPVSHTNAVAALKDAQFHWPDRVYKIVEVQPKNMTKKSSKNRAKRLI